ncbi:hypothetical protein [Nonomuraea sp. NPDC050786]|uniref:hypothetical protein n=1 Tax=Nonomuraea sp. NPDC050786 TaxID=3154840 RepID=UPI0033C206DF
MADLSPIKADFTDYPTRLKALRDHLVDVLQDAPETSVAGISKQLADVMARLEAVAPSETSDSVDELAAARANRRANSGL